MIFEFKSENNQIEISNIKYSEQHIKEEKNLASKKNPKGKLLNESNTILTINI